MTPEPQYYCQFTLTSYGESGTELPPPRKHCTTAMLFSSLGENRKDFAIRMATLGRAARGIYEGQWVISPKSYSYANTCEWRIAEVQTLADAFAKLIVLENGSNG